MESGFEAGERVRRESTGSASNVTLAVGGDGHRDRRLPGKFGNSGESPLRNLDSEVTVKTTIERAQRDLREQRRWSVIAILCPPPSTRSSVTLLEDHTDLVEAPDILWSCECAPCLRY